jgi:glycosyltransferase involved in cell wall biosynthesis
MHNLHSGYFNYLALPRITRGKKVIFTLHDMWAFTGHCAYSNDCERWRQGCGKCPYRESYPAIVLDGSAIEWRLKNWAYSKCSMVVVTPSKWLADLARQSILGRFEVHNIANGLDLRVFKPHDQEEARIELGLPRQATVLMFSANKLDNKRKGAAALIGALWKLPESMRGDVCLLTFGDLDRPPEIPPGMQAVNLGYVREDAIKAKAYSAADVFILPSLADNAPIVIQESLACGTPAIAFPVGGIPEMVIDGETGLLTDRADEQSLYDVLRTALSNVALLRGMRNSCRRFAVLYFDATTQATKYMRVYESAPHQAN